MTRNKNEYNTPISEQLTSTGTYEQRKKDQEELYKKIIELHIHENASVRSIATKLNIGKSTVSRHIKAWKANTPVAEMVPQGGQPKIKPPERTFLGQCVASHPHPTAKSIASALLTSRNVEVSPQTVRNHMKSLDYKSSVPRKIPLITDNQQEKRYQWCIEHRGYNWKNVWFSDETYIEVNRSTIPVWHKKGQRPNVTKRKFEVKIICWRAISMHFKSKLVIVNNTMTADRYIEVLQGYLFQENSGFNTSRHTFQQDNAPCHTAKKVQTFFSTKGITVLPWPANSPDLNPIENIWSILKQNVEKRCTKTKEQLILVIEDEWDKLSMDLIRKTIETMPKRLDEVIKNQGKKCSY